MKTYENDDRDVAVDAFRRMQHGTYITINDVFIDALGDLPAAFLLAKLMYWSRYTDDDGWFTRTQATIERVLGLSRRQFDGARKLLTDRGLIETNRRGMPAQTFYRIDWDAIIRLAAATPPRPDGFESDSYDESKPTPQIVQNVQSRLSGTRNQDRTVRADMIARSGQSLSIEKKSPRKSQPKPVPSQENETPRRPPPRRRDATEWDALDPVADRETLLADRINRPELSPAMVRDPDRAEAWIALQQDWDRRHGRS
ncbi:MAG: hypothetical protein WBA46_14410 [Thermomicrobiales bacterium]